MVIMVVVNGTVHSVKLYEVQTTQADDDNILLLDFNSNTYLNAWNQGDILGFYSDGDIENNVGNHCGIRVVAN